MVGYIVVIMIRSMAVSSVMAMSRAVTMRSIVAVAIVVALVVTVMVGSYSITCLTHHRMAFSLLSQHHVFRTVLLPSWTPCK